MKIGIDLSPLQSPHRMRGIGYTLINLINNIPASEKKKHTFVFYEWINLIPEFGDPIELVDVSGLDYTIHALDHTSHPKPDAKRRNSIRTQFRSTRQSLQRRLPRRVQHFLTVSSDMLAILWGNYSDKHWSSGLSDIDIFIQTDQSATLPHNHKFKKIMLIYDIIPYVLEHAYLISYRTARLKGHSRKGAFRLQAHRWLYIHKLKINIKHADQLVAISNQTKNDFVNYLKTPDSKISVIPLGVTPPSTKKTDNVALYKYVSTPWGYIKRRVELNADIPYILFVGGADRRRKLDDLVTAFNIVKAQGYNIKLVLAGDSMQGPDNISTEETRLALKNSSYLKDIIFMGFIDDDQRDWLYENALAFTFPSKYEGFGLPILEAMIRGCPVISYENAAIREVAHNSILYAKNLLDLSQYIIKLLTMDEKEKNNIIETGIRHAQKYSWEKTVSSILLSITS